MRMSRYNPPAQEHGIEGQVSWEKPKSYNVDLCKNSHFTEHERASTPVY